MANKKCFEVDSALEYDNSVQNFGYTQVRASTETFNQTNHLRYTYKGGEQFSLPCEAYFYVEGKITKDAAGTTPFTPLAPGVWPDYALINNFFPYLFEGFSYSIQDTVIEDYNEPGHATTLYHLLTKKASFKGDDMGWIPDTYDGQVATKDIAYNAMVPFVDAQLSGVTQAIIAQFLYRFIPTFNALNPTAPQIPVRTLANITTDLTANMTPATLTTACNNIIGVINVTLDAAEVDTIVAGDFDTTASPPVAADIPKIITAINKIVTNINKVLAATEADSMAYNTGYKKRKNLLFNPIKNVMPANYAGNFSFRIPLKYLFTFCEQYNKVLYNTQQEIILKRNVNYSGIFRAPTPNQLDCYITIDKIVLYMAEVTPSPAIKSKILAQVATKDANYDLGFMARRLDKFEKQNGKNEIIVDLRYEKGIGKPRYLICAFQSIDKKNPDGAADNASFNIKENINYAIYNSTNLSGRNSTMIEVNKITATGPGLKIELFDIPVNANQNHMARWYSEYKKFKRNYLGDFEEDDIISYSDFNNIYRLYVVDMSRQIESLVATESVDISLKIELGATSPAEDQAEVKLYVLSMFDRLFTIKSDGTRLFVNK